MWRRAAKIVHGDEAELTTGRSMFEAAVGEAVGEGDTFIYVPLDGTERATNWVSFVPTAPESYTFVCAIPGHAQLGMIGSILVTE